MHESSYLKMCFFKEHFLNETDTIKILDVGAYDVNGTYRQIFDVPNWSYFGMDMSDGSNVDIVVKDGYHWKEIETGSFDVVISGQAFEHMKFFWLAMDEIHRVLSPGGICCIIAPSSGFVHRFPVDCYRFYEDGMAALAEYEGMEILYTFMGKDHEAGYDDVFHDDSDVWKDSMLVARKQGTSKSYTEKMLATIENQKDTIAAYENSTCWKMTKWLRDIARLLR